MFRLLLLVSTTASVLGVWSKFLAVIMTVFTFYMLLLLAASFFKRKPSGAEDYEPLVSILIPAHNEESVIERTVMSVLNQTYRKIELIVIDDASVDQTVHILANLKARFPKMIVLRREMYHTRGKPAALNDALQIATGDIVAVFDADAYIAPDFISRVVPHLASRDVAGVQCKVRMYNRNENALTMVQDSELAIFCAVIQAGRDRLGGYCGLGGNGQFVRRSVLLSVGGWPEHTLAEDFDLSLLLMESGHKIHYVNESVFQEAVPKLRALFRQRSRWSQGGLQSTIRHFWRVLFSKKISALTKIDTLMVFSMVLQPLILVASFVLTLFEPHHWVWGWHLSWHSAWSASLFISFVFFIVAGHLESKIEDWRLVVIQSVLYYVYSLLWSFVYMYSVCQYLVKRGHVVWAKTTHASETFTA